MHASASGPVSTQRNNVHRFNILAFEGEHALAQTISLTATHFSVAWSVRLSVVCHFRAPCLNRSTELHATWQVQLQSPITHCVRWGNLTLREGEVWGLNPPSQNLQLPTFDSPGGSTDQRFRFLPNYSCHLLLFRHLRQLRFLRLLHTCLHVYLFVSCVRCVGWIPSLSLPLVGTSMFRVRRLCDYRPRDSVHQSAVVDKRVPETLNNPRYVFCSIPVYVYCLVSVPRNARNARNVRTSGASDASDASKVRNESK